MLRLFRKNSESGQASIEFALVIPLFFILTLAIMEVGWVTYQSMTFRYSYIHASWDIKEKDFNGYEDDMNDEPSAKSYGSAYVVPVIEQSIEDNSLWGYHSDWLEVKSASAVCKNSDTEYTVPGYKGNTTVGINRTRNLEMSCDLTYKIPVLTYVGRMIFQGSEVTINGEINANRIIASAHRTE